MTRKQNMAQRVKLHPENPHQKRIFEVVDVLKDGGVILMPTDSRYALACDYQNKEGMARIRRIRNLDKGDHLTVLCRSIQHASTFALINDRNFKLLKRLTPGTFTFILPATREVPRLLVHPKKRTVGVRIPDYPISLSLIDTLGQPLLAISAKIDGQELPDDRELFLSRFDNLVDLIIDNQQPLTMTESTIVDLTGDDLELVREGPEMDRLMEVVDLEGLTLNLP